MGELTSLGNRTFARVRNFEVDEGLSGFRVLRPLVFGHAAGSSADQDHA